MIPRIIEEFVVRLLNNCHTYEQYQTRSSSGLENKMLCPRFKLAKSPNDDVDL